MHIGKHMKTELIQKVQEFITNEDFTDIELIIEKFNDKITDIISDSEIMDVIGDKYGYFRRAYQIMEFKKYINSPSAQRLVGMCDLKKIRSFDYIPFK